MHRHNQQNKQVKDIASPIADESVGAAKISSFNSEILKKYLLHYFRYRPAFFGLIRPQEGVLFNYYKRYIKGQILDFGCGDGFFAEMVFGRNSIDVGLDLQNSRIDEAKKIGVYNQIVSYNGIKIPFQDNLFESIVSNCVLEHIPNVKNTIQEIYRVTKPGGYFLTGVMTNNWERFMFGPQFFGEYYLASMRKKQEHFNLFPINKWDKLFLTTGFTIVKKQGYVNPRNAKWLDLFHYLSTPSLLSHALSGQWVAWKSWYKVITLDKLALELIQASLDENQPETSSAVFYVLKK